MRKKLGFLTINLPFKRIKERICKLLPFEHTRNGYIVEALKHKNASKVFLWAVTAKSLNLKAQFR